MGRLCYIIGGLKTEERQKEDAGLCTGWPLHLGEMISEQIKDARRTDYQQCTELGA